jgi:hypothetical protein
VLDRTGGYATGPFATPALDCTIRSPTPIRAHWSARFSMASTSDVDINVQYSDGAPIPEEPTSCGATSGHTTSTSEVPL